MAKRKSRKAPTPDTATSDPHHDPGDPTIVPPDMAALPDPGDGGETGGEYDHDPLELDTDPIPVLGVDPASDDDATAVFAGVVNGAVFGLPPDAKVEILEPDPAPRPRLARLRRLHTRRPA